MALCSTQCQCQVELTRTRWPLSTTTSTPADEQCKHRIPLAKLLTFIEAQLPRMVAS